MAVDECVGGRFSRPRADLKLMRRLDGPRQLAECVRSEQLVSASHEQGRLVLADVADRRRAHGLPSPRDGRQPELMVRPPSTTLDRCPVAGQKELKVRNNPAWRNSSCAASTAACSVK